MDWRKKLMKQWNKEIERCEAQIDRLKNSDTSELRMEIGAEWQASGDRIRQMAELLEADTKTHPHHASFNRNAAKDMRQMSAEMLTEAEKIRIGIPVIF